MFHRFISTLSLSLVILVQIIASPARSENCPLQTTCVLKVVNLIAATNINPPESRGLWNHDLIGNLFEGLVALDAEGNVMPGQAEHWDISEDGLTYLFRLRDGLQWSDGHPVLAEHFVLPWVMSFTHQNTGSIPHLLSNVKNARDVSLGKLPPDALGITALDARTIQIKLDQPQSFLPQVLAHAFLSPVPLHQFSDYRPNDHWVSGDGLAFNGPYSLVGSLSDRPIMLERNQNFRQTDDVFFDRIEITTNIEETEAVARFLAGEFDIVRMGADRHTEAVKSMDPSFIITTSPAISTFLVFNLDKPAVQNLRVRRALAMTAMSETLLPAAQGAAPLDSFVPQNIHGYPSEIQIPDWHELPLATRFEQARQLMRDAGFGPEKRLKLQVKITDEDVSVDMGRLLKLMWMQIYVDVDLVPSSRAVHYSQQYIRGGHYDIAELRWLADVNDAHEFLAIFASTSRFNHAHRRSDDYDALLAQYERSQKHQDRDRLVRAMLALVDQELPAIPVFRQQNHNLVQTDLTGYVSNPLAVHPLRFVRRRPTN